MPVSRRDVRKILKAYKTPWFPGSYSSPQKFIKGVRERLRIDVGLRELKDILEKDLAFQMSKVKPLNPNKRRIVSNSVTVSAQIDTGFIHLKIPKTLKEKKKILRVPLRYSIINLS